MDKKERRRRYAAPRCSLASSRAAPSSLSAHAPRSAFAEFFQGIRRGSDNDIRPGPPKGSVLCAPSLLISISWLRRSRTRSGQPLDPNSTAVHWLPLLTSAWLRRNGSQLTPPSDASDHAMCALTAPQPSAPKAFSACRPARTSSTRCVQSLRNVRPRSCDASRVMVPDAAVPPPPAASVCTATSFSPLLRSSAAPTHRSSPHQRRRSSRSNPPRIPTSSPASTSSTGASSLSRSPPSVRPLYSAPRTCLIADLQRLTTRS